MVDVQEDVKEITWKDITKFRREFSELSRDLSAYHSLFNKLFSMGRPTLTRMIPTSAVAFDRDSGNLVRFMWNPEFWNDCDHYTRMFVTCHEILHVMFSHGVRTVNYKMHPQNVNIAIDIVVNHTLIDYFGFDREQLGDLGDKLCWVDTVFPNRNDVKTDKQVEYYIGIIQEELDNGNGMEMDSIDNHDGLGELADDKAKEEIARQLEGGLSDEEKRDFHDKCAGSPPHVSEDKRTGKETPKDRECKDKMAGTIAGDTCYKILKKPPKYNMKWTEVIHEWRRAKMYDEGPEDCWHVPERSHYLLPEDMSLPSALDLSGEDEVEYIDVWFYQDVSGSCVHMAEKFFDAARSFPPNKFKVRAFCFDTRVNEINLAEGKIVGGGGTAFVPIEQSIQNILKAEKGVKYPDAVFVFTDGHAWDHVKPQYPKKWYWFLMDDGYGSSTKVIPKESNIFDLADFAPD